LLQALNRIGNRNQSVIGVWACVCHGTNLSSSSGEEWATWESKSFESVSVQTCIDWILSTHDLQLGRPQDQQPTLAQVLQQIPQQIQQQIPQQIQQYQLQEIPPRRREQIRQMLEQLIQPILQQIYE